MASSTQALAAVIVVIFFSTVKWMYQVWQFDKRYRLPPKVPGVPVFGNSFQVPATQQGPWAKELADKYGEMYVDCITI